MMLTDIILRFVKRPSMEEMLAVLAPCGIGLREGVAIESVFQLASKFEPEISRATIEKGGFEALLTAMGDDLRDQATFRSLGPLSDDVWHFDTECIYEHGDYRSIVENLCRLTRGALAFDQVEDFVQVDDGTAWVRLTRSGRTERLDLKVKDDWVDSSVFALMQQRLVETGSPRRFAVRGLGQDGLIICQTPAAIEALRRATKLRFRRELADVIG